MTFFGKTIAAMAGVTVASFLLSGCGGIKAVPAGDSTTGAAVSPWPACSSAPVTPGNPAVLTSGGWAGAGQASTDGLQIINSGTTTATFTAAVKPVLRGEMLYGHGRTIPASWVHLAGSPVTLDAGAAAWIHITVTVPPGTPRGTYIADFAASYEITSTSTGTSVISFGPAARNYIVFTVGITRPAWQPEMLGTTDPCWAIPGQHETWQQWSHTAYQPPGWYWGAFCGTKCPPSLAAVKQWMYQAPPGWAVTWSNPDDPHYTYTYTGSQPARACISAQEIRKNGWGSGAPGGGPWIGGSQYPDSSTTAGCAIWLHGKA